MKWKQWAIYALWVSGVLLLMFPQLCEGFSVCKKSPIPLVLIIGVIAGILILSDAKNIKKEALENMTKHLEDADEKLKRQEKPKIPK